MFDNNKTKLGLIFCLVTVLATPLIVGAAETPASLTIDDELALGQDVNRQRTFRPAPGTGSAELLGARGGYVHPYISLTGLYTDNVYSASTNEESDFVTTISPGVLLAYPGVKNMQGPSLGTSNLSPGGLVKERTAGFQRFQTSLLYQADFESYKDDSFDNKDRQRVEGRLQFNLKGGLSFDLGGEYKLANEQVAGSLDEYQSDLVDLMIGVKLGRKITLAVGYAGFQLDYDAVGNNARERQDTTYKGRLTYAMLSKTALFAEYQLVDIDYDQQTFADNTITNGNVGLSWDVTAKSSGSFKVGFSSRDHDDIARADADEMSYQLQAHHQFTPKTSVSLTGTRRLTETIVAGTNYIINNQLALTYDQKLPGKFAISLNASFARDNYDQPVTFAGVTKKQVDDTILITPTLDYLMRDWLTASLSYSRIALDSNFDTTDYTTNSVFLRVAAYL